MHGIKTLHRLNAEACEAQRIMAAHDLNHKPDPQLPLDLKERNAHAQETITKILAPTH